MTVQTSNEPNEEFVDGEGRYDRAQRRLADNRRGNLQAIVDDDSVHYPLRDDVSRAVYPDPKAAHLKGESPTLALKRELAEADRGGDRSADPVTKLPDGTPASNEEGVAHNEAEDGKVFDALGTRDAAAAVRDRERDQDSAQSFAAGIKPAPEHAREAGEKNIEKAKAADADKSPNQTDNKN